MNGERRAAARLRAASTGQAGSRCAGSCRRAAREPARPAASRTRRSSPCRASEWSARASDAADAPPVSRRTVQECEGRSCSCRVRSGIQRDMSEPPAGRGDDLTECSRCSGPQGELPSLRARRNARRSKMKWPLMLTCFLLPHSCIFGAPDSSPRCEFPEQWRGSWFQSGENTLIAINGTRISNKGQCTEADGDMFLIYDTEEKCSRCLVMHEKHPNVIQYKETFCTVGKFWDICSHLVGDGQLFSLFRSNAAPSSCPFAGPLEFTYTRGDDRKTCMFPLSQADACTQDSKLLLRYMACADVRGTESFNVEMECLATWKEGSTQYLVSRLNGTGLVNDESRYRCFAYAKSGNSTWNLAQSGDASCNGLTSATEGAKTLKMMQKSESSRCAFPGWLVRPYSWVALERTASTRLLAGLNNVTILDQHETQFACHYIVRGNKHSELKSQSEAIDRFQIVARATRGCTNGFVCVVFHKRDDHVIEMQQSQNWTQQEDEACKPSVFEPLSAPYTTFITMEPTTRQCPYLGRYVVVVVTRPPGHGYAENVAEVRSARMTSTPQPTRCHQASVEGLNIGCTRPDLMEFATDCTDKALFKYSCHGTWVENDTAYLVASTETDRYCLVYSASASGRTTSSTSSTSRELTVTGHLASCPRAAHLHKHEWQVNLTAYAQCDDVSSASTWRSSGSSLTTHVLFVLGALLSRYFGR